MANNYPSHLPRNVSDQLFNDPCLLNHSSTFGTCLQAVLLALPQLRITVAVTIRNWSDRLGLQPAKRYVQGRASLKGARRLDMFLIPHNTSKLQTFKHNHTYTSPIPFKNNIII